MKIFDLDGARIHDKLSLLDETARVCGFPDYFGRNWDALNDCLYELKQKYDQVTIRVLGFKPDSGGREGDARYCLETAVTLFTDICIGQGIDVVLATQKSAHDLLPRANLYDILEPIRLRPALYLGSKSLARLVSYIHGIQHVGGDVVGQPSYFKLDGRLNTHEFGKFVTARYPGVAHATAGWGTVILEAERNETGDDNADVRAFDRFFELLDEFRSKQ